MRWGRRKCSIETIFMREEVARGKTPLSIILYLKGDGVR